MSADSRKLSEKHLSVLLVKRLKQPYEGQWCLPGGYVKIDETLNRAADRILIKETNLHDIYKEQIYTFSDIDRDPRLRTVSVAYLSLIDKEKIKDELSDEGLWFDVDVKEDNDTTTVMLTGNNETLAFHATRKRAHPTSDAYRYEVTGNDRIAFDHCQMILSGLHALRQKTEHEEIVFNMMPTEFTLGELQQVYEAIIGKVVWTPAFRRIIAKKVQKTGHMVRTGGHRPSESYQYKSATNGGKR